MGSIGILTAVVCVHLVSGNMPESPLHQHPTLVAMLERNNELRETMGLSAHNISPELTQAAQDHARYMAGTGYFDHYINGGPQGRATRHGYNGWVRENIAMGYTTVDQAFNGWHYSSGHWASIISDTPEAGFGYAIGPGGTGYWVGMYGYPQQEVAKPVVDGEEAVADATTTDDTYYSNNYSNNRRRRGILRRRRR